jgi:putative oxidoreductase
MRDLALLILRVVIGGLLAGHGSQKLFGAFEGPGLQGTRQMMAGLGLRPDDKWALAAGGSEFAGGTLTALGFLHPLGPIIAMAPMGAAIKTVHWASRSGPPRAAPSSLSPTWPSSPPWRSQGPAASVWIASLGSKHRQP